MAQKLKVKYNTLTGLADVPDTCSFTLQCHVDFNTQSIGNCGLTVLSYVRRQWQVASYGTVPDLYKSPWGEPNTVLHGKMLEKVAELNKDLQSEEALVTLKDEVIEKAQRLGYQCYIMSDCCNRHSGARGQHANNAAQNTADFADFLYRNKIGYIVRSPISLNHVHDSTGDLSLIRTWIWYPPGSIVFKDGTLLGRGEIFKTPEEAAEASLKRPKHNQLSEGSRKKYIELFKNWNINIFKKKEVDKKKKA